MQSTFDRRPDLPYLKPSKIQKEIKNFKLHEIATLRTFSCNKYLGFIKSRRRRLKNLASVRTRTRNESFVAGAASCRVLQCVQIFLVKMRDILLKMREKMRLKCQLFYCIFRRFRGGLLFFFFKIFFKIICFSYFTT